MPDAAPAGAGGGIALEGETLDGRYRVDGRLGEGGMATVYLAEDLRLTRTVVVKVPHAALLLEPGFRKRFEQEVTSLTTLEHPHVVKIHDTGEFRGVPYAVMQHLAGGSLVDRMKAAGGRLVPPEVVRWLSRAAAALDFIHRQGLVHRDVKPENILFDRDGNPFLADFGIAKAVSGIETKITRTGLLAGSPAYMAPEVVRGDAAGPPYDQYALALVVYEALTGRLPHEGTTPLSLLTKRAYEPPAELAPLAPDLPAGAAAAVMRALLKDPGRRFASCAEFASAFERGLAGEMPEAPPPILLPRGRKTLVAEDTAPEPGDGTPRPVPSRLGILLALGAASVAVAAAVLALTGGGAGPSRPPAGVRGSDSASKSPPAADAPKEQEAAASPAPAAKPKETPWKLVTPPGAPEWVRISEEQVEAAERHGVPAWFENDLGMRFVLIPEGKFQMGSPLEEPGRRTNEPLHEVRIERPFYLQATEITLTQYRKWNPAHAPPPVFGVAMDDPSLPVTHMSGYAAMTYARWVESQDTSRDYWLPAETEWEYACRAGTEGRWYWGDSLEDATLFANVADAAARRRDAGLPGFPGDDGYGALAPPGAFPPNPWGLHDILGNVREICWKEGVNPHPAAADPHNGDATVTVGREDGWSGSPAGVRTALRQEGNFGGPWMNCGFRLAAGLPVKPAVAVADPAEGAELAEGAVVVRGSARGLPSDAALLVNGVRAVPQGGSFLATITLPPGDQEIEVLLDGRAAALCSVKVAAAPRPAPPEVPEWAKVSAQQVAEARRLGVPVAFENPLGMRFVLIPAGRFAMGSPPTDKFQGELLHQVTLTRAYYLGVTEVTNAQYRRWRPGPTLTPYKGHGIDGDDQPVVAIGSAGADSYARWLAGQDPDRRYRLPTEAEWEYACRAGTQGVNWWGDGIEEMGRYANVADLSAKRKWPEWQVVETDDGQPVAAAVGSYPPSPWGLHDMIGNVAEFCSDCYEAYGPLPLVDPAGPSPGKDRISRGGAWAAMPASFQASTRGWGEPPGGAVFTGFRLAADLPAGSPEARLAVAEPAEGATLSEGAVLVRGSAYGVSREATLLVNGVRAVVKDGSFEATITLPPGDLEVEVLLDGKALALRNVKVAPSPRPAPPEAPEWAKVSAQQVAEAKRLGVPVAFENPLGMRFVLIPAGRFHMGSPVNEAGRGQDETQHVVTLTRPFYMQSTEVTNAQFRRIEPGIEPPDVSDALKMPVNGAEQPQIGLSTGGAAAACRSLGIADPTRRYRLPTEAEWEYACRAGTRSQSFWGDAVEEAGKYANCADLTAKEKRASWVVAKTRDGWVESAPVGSFQPNPWGLFDIVGNAREMCADFYAPFSDIPAIDPTGPPSGERSVARGGSFIEPGGNRSAWRRDGFPGGGWPDGGFRVVCDLPEGN